MSSQKNRLTKATRPIFDGYVLGAISEEHPRRTTDIRKLAREAVAKDGQYMTFFRVLENCDAIRQALFRLTKKDRIVSCGYDDSGVRLWKRTE